MDRSESAGSGSLQEPVRIEGGTGSKPEGVAPQGPPGIDEGLSKKSDAEREGDPGRPLRGDARPGEEGAAGAAAPAGPGGGRPRPPLTLARTARIEDLDVHRTFSPAQRLLLLDAWMRSRLPATEFGSLVSVTPTTLYQWKRRFEASGPAGLSDRSGGRRLGSRLPEPTRRAILMLKEAHPDWGQDRLHDVLLRSEGYGASPGAIAGVLEEEGYVVELPPTPAHEPKVARFERPRPNVLWQTDLFTFLLRRENRRVHLVGFLDSCEATGYVESRRPAP